MRLLIAILIAMEKENRASGENLLLDNCSPPSRQPCPQGGSRRMRCLCSTCTGHAGKKRFHKTEIEAPLRRLQFRFIQTRENRMRVTVIQALKKTSLPRRAVPRPRGGEPSYLTRMRVIFIVRVRTHVHVRFSRAENRNPVEDSVPNPPENPTPSWDVLLLRGPVRTRTMKIVEWEMRAPISDPAGMRQRKSSARKLNGRYGRCEPAVRIPVFPADPRRNNLNTLAGPMVPYQVMEFTSNRISC